MRRATHVSTLLVADCTRSKGDDPRFAIQERIGEAATMRHNIIGILALALVAICLSPGGAAWGHHSFSAQYDSNQPVSLRGAVTKIEWNNPHVYFYIDVRDEATGRMENWALEMGAPAVIQRNGWRRNTMKIGDIVLVEGTRARSGDPLANARSVTMASTGTRLGAGSSEGVTP
jgi:hypothetical protein